MKMKNLIVGRKYTNGLGLCKLLGFDKDGDVVLEVLEGLKHLVLYDDIDEMIDTNCKSGSAGLLTIVFLSTFKPLKE